MILPTCGIGYTIQIYIAVSSLGTGEGSQSSIHIAFKFVQEDLPEYSGGSDNTRARMCIVTDISLHNAREYRRGNQNGQSRETGNIVYTRGRKAKQTHKKYS